MQDFTSLFHRLLRPLAAPVAAAGLTLTGGCHEAAPTDEKATATAVAPREVPVVEARSEVWPETIRVQGSLMGDEYSVIGAKIAGRVESVPVDLGSKVRQGQTLMVLDRSELQLRVQQAEAQLRQECAAIGMTPDMSETELRRENSPPVRLEKALVDEARMAVARIERLSRQSVSESELERLQAQLKTAEARYQSALNSVGEQIALIGLRRTELAIAQQQLADATIVAPFDGVIERRQAAPGQYVQVGDPVVTLVRADTLRFTAGAPESKAAALRPGQPIRIHVRGEPQPLAATISRVSPMVNQASRALWIEADVPNPDIRLQAGLFAEAEIVIDATTQSLTIPADAITEFAGIEKVWVVREGKAVEQPVRTGRHEGGRVEILEGLNPGALIVSNANAGQVGPVIAVREDPRPIQASALPAHSAE